MFQPRRRNRKVKGAETLPERILQLKECTDMLVASGYFRARIGTLSPFDRVVGGICWCLSAVAASSNVDYALVFKENSSLGEKIQLSDQLVKNIVKLRCPEPLQSHQIQGLDYPALKKVIRFLLIQVMEVRKATGDTTTQVARNVFSKAYSYTPVEAKEDEDDGSFGLDRSTPQHSQAYMNDVFRVSFKPRRRFKAPDDQETGADLRTQAAGTLLEYGERIYAVASVATDVEKDEANRRRNAGRSKNAALIAKLEGAQGGSSAEPSQGEQDLLAAEHDRLASLEGQLAQVGKSAQKGRISASQLGAIVSLRSGEIHEASKQFAKDMEEGAEGLAEETPQSQASAQHQRQVRSLERRIAETQKALKELEAAQGEVQQSLSAVTETLEKKESYRARIDQETAKLVSLENDEKSAGKLAVLNQVVEQGDSLKAQTSAFKESCKNERARWKRRIAALSGKGEDEDEELDEETRKIREIEALHARDLKKLQKVRQLLAKRNQEIANLSRDIDELPTRAELLQYERRFVELYDLSSAKLVETRKYFDTYNVLKTTLEYMEKEKSLLNSIIEQWPHVANASPATKEKFLAHFQSILDGIGANISEEKEVLDQENTMLQAKQSKHESIVKFQRLYFKAIKDFQEECVRNERLAAEVEKMQAASA